MTENRKQFNYLLVELGLTQTEFARMIGVSRETVSRWRSVPRVVLLYLKLLVDLRVLTRLS